VDENRRRGKLDPEFELIDTGIFDENKYFDVFIEYAKADDEDILIRITIHNRGPKAATLHVLPQIWFRNTWAWGYDNYKPEIAQFKDGVLKVSHRDLGDNFLSYEGKAEVLFCENDTNTGRLYNHPTPGTFKDGINDFLISGKIEAVNPVPK